ncbi:phenylacetate--CoA ligase family protein [Micromonospora sp. WMMD1082]|uniref:phenylacetate--CoA ligase family protein n=1 Tax=Micromonospora sp. WMMD1082 TaxID=3016104 RepID=UPI002415E875|nr:phenylacetate--CoA ligase family protein [Micromonospora sp. WMMD1082]MDG4795724.1 phenylacetate--CoA ligase family protein [Micromonospora sp. WMMD1082]
MRDLNRYALGTTAVPGWLGPNEWSEDEDEATRALELFQDVAATVPAYRSFLEAHGLDPTEIQAVDDFARIPLLTKEGYQRRYPLPDLCRGGRLDGCDVVAVSSGSSGQPTVWPRSTVDELVVSQRFEQVMHGSFRADTRRTLAVVCFALGNWVGGMYTAACWRHLASRGYAITIATPGNNVEEILRVVTELGPHFDQVVLAGYPPFLKGLIDAGVERDIDWPRYSIRLLLAGEVFSEQWRDLVGRRAGMSRPAFDSASLYGTADAGVLGNETPLSITIRRFLAANPAAARELFGADRLPTLVQYDPMTRYFETHGHTLVFSCDGEVPLVRYHIADEGGVVPYQRMLRFCRDRGFDPLAAVVEGDPHAGDAVPTRGAPALPFVYVFGRSLFAVSYFGANVYPENIAAGLEHPDVAEWVTGKFVLGVTTDAEHEPALSVVVELAPGIHPELARAAVLTESVHAALLRLNSEFAHYVPSGRQLPRVDMRTTGDAEYFPPGVKHRYTRAG